MTEYKLLKSFDGNISAVLKNNADTVPFAPDNADYQAFKKDLADGAELQDAEGNVIDGIAYLEELV
jgi:hypothetical protein